MGTPPEENKPNVKESPSGTPSMVGGLVDLFKSNMGDTIAYIIVALSLLYSFFDPFVGGIPVGFILGLYFSKKVFQLASQFREFLVTEGIFRGFIIIAAVAAIVITAPGLSLGFVLGTFTRPFFTEKGSTEEPPQTKEKK